MRTSSEDCAIASYTWQNHSWWAKTTRQWYWCRQSDQSIARIARSEEKRMNSEGQYFKRTKKDDAMQEICFKNAGLLLKWNIFLRRPGLTMQRRQSNQVGTSTDMFACGHSISTQKPSKIPPRTTTRKSTRHRSCPSSWVLRWSWV